MTAPMPVQADLDALREAVDGGTVCVLADAVDAVLDLCAEVHEMGSGSLTARQVRDAIREALR